MKYYMADDSDFVEPLCSFKEMLIEDNLEEMELLELERDIGGEMWCEEREDFIEKGDCDRWCNHYKPCNGISGRCKNLKNGFILTGRKFLLTKNGLKEVNHDKV